MRKTNIGDNYYTINDLKENNKHKKLGEHKNKQFQKKINDSF